uniref:interleukin-17 receptor A-like n=1 Tax=Monopterus albus TaxID=43700 RepID=UPI0009B3BD1C|nr:interleukin-17 receptor A-like [Monopterus albus]
MPANCSDKHKSVLQQHAPTTPEWGHEHVGVRMDRHGPVPVMDMTWKIKSDGSIFRLNGSEISILDESTNQSICVEFSLNLTRQLNPNHSQWTFSLDGVVVEPEHTYMLSVFNLPEPMSGDNGIRKQITIPGCGASSIQMAQMCLENGSLWDPHMATNLSIDKEHKKLFIVVGFEAAQYSESYQVSIQSNDLYYSKNVSKQKNRISLSVTFELDLWQLSQCEMLLTIQPFFVQCKNDCWRPKKMIDYCPCKYNF